MKLQIHHIIYIYIFQIIHIITNTSDYICIYFSLYTYIHIYVCVCVYIYIYIYKISDLACVPSSLGPRFIIGKTRVRN